MNESGHNSGYDLCGEIIGSAMKVHRKLGFGFLESVYNKALSNELKHAGHKVENEVPIKVRHEEQIVGDFYADLLVADLVIVELKAVERMVVAHEEGLLLNFGTESLDFRNKFRRTLAQQQKSHSVNSVQPS